MKTHCTIIQICFLTKVTLNKQTKKPPAGMLATEVRSGDAPKPPFPMKIDEKSKKSENQPLNRQKKKSLFPSLLFLSLKGMIRLSDHPGWHKAGASGKWSIAV